VCQNSCGRRVCGGSTTSVSFYDSPLAAGATGANGHSVTHFVY